MKLSSSLAIVHLKYCNLHYNHKFALTYFSPKRSRSRSRPTAHALTPYVSLTVSTLGKDTNALSQYHCIAWTRTPESLRNLYAQRVAYEDVSDCLVVTTCRIEPLAWQPNTTMVTTKPRNCCDD